MTTMTFNKRKIADNITNILMKKEISIGEFANLLNVQLKDICKIIDGRVLLSTNVINKIVNTLNIDEKELYNDNNNNYENIRYYLRHKFSDPDNYDRVLDILDMYIDLEEKKAAVR